MKKIEIKSELHLREAAEEFVDAMQTYKIFAFYGEMGAGKTSLIKVICRVLGVTDTVSSPSFALVNEYESPLTGIIYHFDLYRMKRIEELFDLGYEDYFFGGDYCFIEWPEMAEHLLPEHTLKVYFQVNPDKSRTLNIPELD